MLVTRFLGLALAASFTLPAMAQEEVPATTPAQPAQETRVQREGIQERQKDTKHLVSTQVVGASIYGANEDDAIGSINDIVMTKDGKVLYFVAGSGGVAGVGQTEHAVPASAFNFEMRQDGDEKELHVSLPLTEEDLENAPELSVEHGGDLTVASFHERNSKYFKTTDAQQVQKGNFFLVSELTDLDVMGTNNESVGHLDALLLNKSGKELKASYYVLGSGGVVGIGQEYTAVPFEKVTVQVNDNHEYQARINADERIIKAAPKVKSDNYFAELGNEQKQQEVKNAFSEVK